MQIGKEAKQLTDIEIARLDAVDRPASGHRWLIKKSEGANMDPALLEKAALSLMECMTKDAGAEGLAMSEESLASLNSLAKALGIESQFKAKAAPAAPEEKPVEPPAAPVVPPKPEEDPNAEMRKGLETLTKTVGDLVTKIESMPTPVAKSVEPTPPSKQPAGQDKNKPEPKKLGEGMFSNIVFAKTKQSF